MRPRLPSYGHFDVWSILYSTKDLVANIQSSIIKLKVVKHLAAGDSIIFGLARVQTTQQRLNKKLSDNSSYHVMCHERFN